MEITLTTILLTGPALLAVLLVLHRALKAGIPSIHVALDAAESDDVIDKERYNPSQHGNTTDRIPCYDPGTMQFLGYAPAMTAAEVKAKVAAARAAEQVWRHSTFAQRKQVLQIMLKYIVETQDTICRVSARDSGKPMVDAAFGEVMVTCEKIWWLLKEGQRYLKSEKRSPGLMMFYKSARVEYHPVGVVGAIVSWNYPFHNVFNPLTAAIFAGNAIVIKVSEHASWSAQYYGRIISASLQAAGAPADLVQIVTGYVEAGNGLVTAPVDKVIFVGSPEVGRKVMESASRTLTPVVLELGGKDAFIVCDDADLDQAIPTGLRGGLQSCGQNCAGVERFIVHSKVYDEFVERLTSVVRRLRQGPALGHGPVDCGAICMPGHVGKVDALVQDAMQKGARLLAGGSLPPANSIGQFYPATVLADVTPNMRIWQEEVFGPVLSISRFETDDDAVALANNNLFGLGSAVWSRNQRRANAIAERLEAGMTSINDFATTYMCQSLPFGGVKHSGFDRFAGVEGLRGMCVAKAVAEDRLPWAMSTTIPPILQYPVGDGAYDFTSALIAMFYSPTWAGSMQAVFRVIVCLLPMSLRTSFSKKQKQR